MLILKNLTKGFAGKTLFEDINFNFSDSGIYGLFGVNGAGKSTLINIISGQDEPDAGSITMPRDYVVSHLPQDPHPHPKETIISECMAGNDMMCDLKEKLDLALHEMGLEYSEEAYAKYEKAEAEFTQKDGYSFEADASKILAGLGFTQDQLLDNPLDLSGGWRMRLELAKLLVRKPNFILLDEPTNHLDLPSIIWLEGYLKKFTGVVLFISHDLDLLNKLPDYMLHIKDKTLRSYVGNFDSFIEQSALIEEQKRKEISTASKKIDELSRFVDRFKSKASKATQAQSKMKMIDKMQSKLSEVNVDTKDKGMHLDFPIKSQSGKDVITIKNLTTGNDGVPLLKKINLHVHRGQKIAIVGANGIGKTTFMRTLTKQIPPIEGELKFGHNVITSYFAQDQLKVLDLNKNVLENLEAVSPEESNQRLRTILGSFLFSNEAVFKPASVLSGGEKNRLSLACMLTQKANLLLLDEPTNHLDMLSTEILADSLAAYEGTVVLISHNRSFINRVATHVMLLDKGGKSHLYEGNLENINLENL